MKQPGVTIVIPIYNLDINRETNLKFIIEKLIKTKYKIIVVEQVSGSKKSNLLQHFPEIEHQFLRSSTSRIQKSWLINNSCNFVNTTHIWVVDCDFYMDFDQLPTDYIISYKFIQPYYYARDLSYSETIEFIKDPDISKIKYYNGLEDNHRHVNIYGALSFIFEIDAFLQLGMMDERYEGWGHEDIDLFLKLHTPDNGKVIEVNNKQYGVHLWHPDPVDKETTSKQNLTIFEGKNYSNDLATELTLKYYYPTWGKR